MTQSKQIIVLDCSTSKVFILPVEHNPNDDMEVSVQDAYEKFNENNDDSYYLKDSQCSWMELDDDFTTDQIIHAYNN